MHLSRVRITNFRNFAALDVALSGNVLMVGENRVGKSNFIFALRLVMDSSLPDSARELNSETSGSTRRSKGRCLRTSHLIASHRRHVGGRIKKANKIFPLSAPRTFAQMLASHQGAQLLRRSGRQ